MAALDLAAKTLPVLAFGAFAAGFAAGAMRPAIPGWSDNVTAPFYLARAAAPDAIP